MDEYGDSTDAGAAFVAKYGAIVPPIFRWEVQNGLHLAVRRSRLTIADADAQLDDLDRLNIVYDGESMRAPFRLGISLARRYQLTAYDAAYLELAVRLKRPLMTRDRRLADVARELGLLWKPEPDDEPATR